MARYKVILKYDGSAFHGMQRQENARTVQGEVENSLRQIGWDGRSIMVAGRTDSGVHAFGQVIAFDMDWKHPVENLLKALNATLPDDTAVSSVEEAGIEFHPRFDAVARTYRYQIYFQSQRDPLRDRFAWRVWPDLDLEILNEAASCLVGEHDFAAFGAPLKEGGPTIRFVDQAGWKQGSQSDEIYFEVTANAYLYHMVRRMVMIQVDIGHGKQDLAALKAYLARKREGMIQGLAPPQGLFLQEVRYE